MPRCVIDHLTVTAPTLAAGVAHVQEKLGVAMQAGGEHPRMGTHNSLLRLGERVFLEVIAVDPAALAPGRPRWFDLDGVTAATPPRLGAWVARTDDIEATTAASPLPLGRVQPMSRGALNWQISIPDDGSRPLEGILPILIQWAPGSHPADSLAADDVIQANCLCAGTPVDCEGTPGGGAVPGTPCDDFNPGTIDDVYQLDCTCAGVIVDCLGIPGGPNLPGAPCNDFDPSTNDEDLAGQLLLRGHTLLAERGARPPLRCEQRPDQLGDPLPERRYGGLQRW